MTVVLILESEAFVGPDLRWPLRIAAPLGGELRIAVAVGQEKTDVRRIDLSSSAESGGDDLGRRVREALDEYLGADGWTAGAADSPRPESPAASDPAKPAPLRVGLYTVPEKEVAERALGRVKRPDSDFLVLVTSAKSILGGGIWGQISLEFERRTACQIAHVIPGERREAGDVVAAAAAGRNARAAIRLAAGMARGQDRRLIGLYAERDVGPDAERVGRRFLDQRLRAALDDGLERVGRRVEVADDPAQGILRACADPNVELVVMGVSRLGAKAEGKGDIPMRVARAVDGPTLVGVSSPVPLQNWVRRRAVAAFQQLVPQLERDDRTGLVERIQSTAQWNFDFVLLMGMATTIAALGLLDNSPAVIIGAMLIAPLMTPLLGLGLAIAQGNPRLARMTLKASGLGFLTAFVVAFLVGFLSREFHQLTPEMAARDWPQMLDLFVAFFGGFAAAYASGRPGLLAALPGVAIAAALVPPIATSGLAVSIGSYELAMGALMLFAANMVTIILAAAVCFWSVGIRIGRRTVTTRVITAIVVISAVGMAVGFTLAPPRLAPPRDLVEAMAATLEDEARLRNIRLKKEGGTWVVQVDLGGTTPPDEALQDGLLRHAKDHFGEEAGVRVTYRFETVKH